jgi:hypothetical protein
MEKVTINPKTAVLVSFSVILLGSARRAIPCLCNPGLEPKMKAILTTSLLLLSSLTWAKEKQRRFNQPCAIVFPIAEKMSSEKPYHLLLDGKTDMILRVQTGSFWKAGAADIDVQFTANPDGTCTVTDNSPYSGVRKNGTVYLDRLEKRISETR